jgi:hypothetical protein
MTTPLIEAIARKQCEQHIREVRRWDTDPAKLEAMLPGAVDVNWQDHVALAQAALTAITEQGMAIVPRQPTKAMVGAGHYLMDHEDPGLDDIYRAMSQAGSAA